MLRIPGAKGWVGWTRPSAAKADVSSFRLAVRNRIVRFLPQAAIACGRNSDDPCEARGRAWLSAKRSPTDLARSVRQLGGADGKADPLIVGRAGGHLILASLVPRRLTICFTDRQTLRTSAGQQRGNVHRSIPGVIHGSLYVPGLSRWNTSGLDVSLD